MPASHDVAVLDAAKAYADAAEMQVQAAEAVAAARDSDPAAFGPEREFAHHTVAAQLIAIQRLSDAERTLKIACLVYAGHDPTLAGGPVHVTRRGN